MTADDATGALDREPRIAVVFAQYDRQKYSRALQSLAAALDRVAAETTFVVVDNAVTGEWSHSVSATLHHVGGDNGCWEFSAFVKGLRWLGRRGCEADLYVFATDAVLAYGADFLDLVDDRVIDCCRRIPACSGWVDSFMESCQILGHSYDSWIRSSLLFVPSTVLPRLEPLAHRLDDEEIFGPDLATPFRPTAPLSENLRSLLLEWLTYHPVGSPRLGNAWHSRFHLDGDTFGLFKAKVKAILREHLLSARLRALGVRCLDLRAIRRLGETGLLGTAAYDPQWDWLGWLPPRTDAASVNGNGPPQPIDAPAVPGLLETPRAAAGPPSATCPTGAGAIRLLEREVLPLVLQRHPRARLATEAAGAPVPAMNEGPALVLSEPGEGTVALLLPPGVKASPQLLRWAARLELPLVGARPSGLESFDGRHYLEAERPCEYATACCRLIEDAALRADLGRSLRELIS